MPKISDLTASTALTGDDLLVMVNDPGGTPASRKITATNAKKFLDSVVNVVSYGATGDGSTDDATAIQNAIDAAPSGSTVYFPPGTYVVGTTIELKPHVAYEGDHRRTSVLKHKASANLSAIACSEVWLSASGSPTSDTPLSVRHLGFDGNRTNTAGTGHGLVLMNYYSTVDDVEIYDTDGDGLRWTTQTLAGNTVTNTMVENHLFRVQVTNAGGRGIHVKDPAFNKLTDGWIVDCAVNMSSQGDDAIFVDSAAGWRITGNHTYGTTHNGINVNRSAWTRVSDNYVETFGSSEAETQYAGIAMGENRYTWTATAGWSVVANNTVKLDADNSGTDNIGISVYAASGGTGEVIITGNALTGVSGSTYGIYVSNQSGSATVRAHIAGNKARGWSTPYGGSANGGTLELTGNDAFPIALATNATEGFTRMPTCAGTPSGTPTDLTAGMPFVYDTTNNRLYFYQSSAWHYIARTA